MTHDPHVLRRDEQHRRELVDLAKTLRHVARKAPEGFDFKVETIRKEVRAIEEAAMRR